MPARDPRGVLLEAGEVSITVGGTVFHGAYEARNRRRPLVHLSSDLGKKAMKPLRPGAYREAAERLLRELAAARALR